MTCGIYKLKFLNTPKFYIGKAINIERRFTKHKSSLKYNRSSIKLQEAYRLYGNPILEILCICEEDELDYLENKYIVNFNTIQEGFNTTQSITGGCELFGEDAGNSKYTNEIYINVFLDLINTNNTLKDIAEKYNINKSIVGAISSCYGHKWLKEKYPIEYKRLEEIKGNRHTKEQRENTHSAKTLGIIYPSIISTSTGEIVNNIENATKFAKSRGINIGNFNSMLNGKRLTCQGWKIYKGDINAHT